MWILSPTASESILNGFGARMEPESWGEGIYFLADYLRTAIVVIHQLPRTELTLWLRLLGRGRVQEEAIDDLKKLLPTHPLRSNVLKVLTNLQANLQTSQDLEPEEQGLIMKLSPLYVEWEEEALKKGEQQGIQLSLPFLLKPEEHYMNSEKPKNSPLQQLAEENSERLPIFGAWDK